MRLTELTIKNYRSFDDQGQTVTFTTNHTALVGKNNSGKSNLFNALNIVLGDKVPNYAKFSEDDYWDISKPIEIQVTLGDIKQTDKSLLFNLPSITKAQQGALNASIPNGSAKVTLLLRKNFGLDNEEATSEETQDTFDINLWGFNVFRKKEETRKILIKLLLIPAVRDSQDILSATSWTPYGQLMKEVLESSPSYAEIKRDLESINNKIQIVFDTEKTKLVEQSKIVSYVDDISFRLTKSNNPSELLRNLIIFVREGSKEFDIEHVGTGTQNAVILGILELALKSKNCTARIFCIEEPEAFIHPHGIRYLGSLIKNVSSKDNIQVIFSTHSVALTANFEPNEIVRICKEDGKTVIKQNSSFSSTHYKRFIHPGNADIFFSDRIVLVEGATEKILLNNLDKITYSSESDSSLRNCNLDRKNVGVIAMDSVDSIMNYIEIAKGFDIPYIAITDKDLVESPHKEGKLKSLCSFLGITYQKNDIPKLVNDLRNNSIIVNTKGEIEDVFDDKDIEIISGVSVATIKSLKAKHPNKTSKAFIEIFNCGKPEYALKIADHYEQNKSKHPLEDTIRKIYSNDSANISL
ncbi:hypothetical protein C4561_01315 [candidate division WWE3 bacterium]|jgi:predicted ATP-dependent endonuclease of OLD family|uniref:Uncharacterized protein n=1 Tax=candidate division WWE3 bacterium TaxID=2053526 RepID=A0A3A4ZLY9_UNCKA|nr:MAG: hypothetical protein C4561_01315 [candidate division WWE3 bacterium]